MCKENSKQKYKRAIPKYRHFLSLFFWIKKNKQMFRYNKVKFFTNIKCGKEFSIPDLFDLHNLSLK